MSIERTDTINGSAKSGADTTLFLGLVLVGLTVFALAVAVGVTLGSAPGSLADWIAAVSTFAALLAAGYAAIQTRRTFGLEQGRDADRVEQIRRAQAVQVAAWPGEMDWVGTKITHSFGPGSALARVTQSPGVMRPESIPMTIQNASTVPVWHFAVEIYVGAGTSESATHAASSGLADRENGIALVGRMSGVEIVTPELVGDLVDVLETIPGADRGPAKTWFGWSFQDNGGQWWRRYPTGALVPLDGPPGPHPPKRFGVGPRPLWR